MFLPAQFFKPIVIDAEVVGYFVLDDALYLGNNLRIVFTHSLDGFLENGYLVRCYESVVVTSPGQGHAFVEPEQGFIPLYSRTPQLGTCRLIGNDDIDIFQPFTEFIG